MAGTGLRAGRTQACYQLSNDNYYHLNQMGFNAGDEGQFGQIGRSALDARGWGLLLHSLDTRLRHDFENFFK